MLNQPTHGAFVRDFFGRNADSSAVASAASFSKATSINNYPMASEQVPMRLTRFARVLKESASAFRGCHIGNFPGTVRPYFGDFAVCHHCLEEGFHSLLYSFEGLRSCPVHGTKLESVKSNSALATDVFNNALRYPFRGCQYLQKILGYPEARNPKVYAGRDHVLGELAEWLMDIDSRCWLGQHGVQQVEPIEGFVNRLAHLKITLRLPSAVPNLVDADGLAKLKSATTEVIRFGSVKVCKGDLVDIDDRRAGRYQTDLNIYGRAIFGDFKAIRRYLKRIDLGNHGRHWLGHLSKATSVTDVKALLDQGGERARRAWMFLAWSGQIAEREFNQKVGLHTRPMRFAVDGNIPLWVANLRSCQPTQRDHDFVHLWIARWISAAGLLARWRSVCAVAEEQNPPDIVALESALPAMRHEPKWSLGISADDELILCVDHGTPQRSKPAVQ